jgi:hypothetical protein
LLDGGDTVTVLVLVLTDVLIDVLTLGSVDVVVAVGAVVSADGGDVVSVTVCVGATAGADPDGADVVFVVEVVVWVLSVESDIRLTNNHTMRAMRIATSAPKPTSAAGLRYQGTGGSGGWPGWPGCS